MSFIKHVILQIFPPRLTFIHLAVWSFKDRTPYTSMWGADQITRLLHSAPHHSGEKPTRPPRPAAPAAAPSHGPPRPALRPRFAFSHPWLTLTTGPVRGSSSPSPSPSPSRRPGPNATSSERPSLIILTGSTPSCPASRSGLLPGLFSPVVDHHWTASIDPPEGASGCFSVSFTLVLPVRRSRTQWAPRTRVLNR